MTQGDMREIYPETGEAHPCRIEEREGRFFIDLQDSVGAGFKPALTGITIEPPESGHTVGIDSRESGEGICRVWTSDGEVGRTCAFAWAWVGPPTGSRELHLWLDGNLFVFQRAEASTRAGRRRGNAPAGQASGDVLAPMPGAVLEVLVGEGDTVERNQTVVLMESMKMELVITAPRSGVVRQVAVQPGQQVDRGMRLLELAPGGDSGEG